MKKEVKDWLDYAGRDILSTLALINNPDLTQMVAFHC
jgi:hypothetical protein